MNNIRVSFFIGKRMYGTIVRPRVRKFTLIFYVGVIILLENKVIFWLRKK
ncbi:hypothetical protein J2Z22_001395 [Paenibacillus forsythiae]|uniref:Uncharacterized protein n=1 Tax=Paenibacillus forsythiae TaxID=365616 RepID=A0ABU3H4X8_9BACL|nr:hypothetical protein [Paenibacillus forsythiae]